MSSFSRVRIVGSGLIGTSIGLALVQCGFEVEMSDSSATNAELAQSLIASQPLSSPAELTIIAVPPQVTFEVLMAEYMANPKSTFMDVNGIKSDLMHKVEEFSALSTRFCGSHPMAGREISGVESAQADLFEGRAWILTPTSAISSESFQIAYELVAQLKATSYVITPEEHDLAMAAISQLPQLVSSALGATIFDQPEIALNLAGAGLRDTSRLASSSGELWSALLISNRAHLLPILARFQESISALSKAINRQDDLAIKGLFERAALGRARISGKHGAKVRDYTYLPIVIDDRPGQLGALFQECALAQVNVEDLTIEHSPGQQTGLITLALSAIDAEKLRSHLSEKGWSAHAPK